MKDVLFVGHTADLSGAPKALLLLSQWIRERRDLSFEFLLGAGGVLKGEFSQLARTTMAADAAPGFHQGFRVIYANSVWAHPIVSALGGPYPPVISHVHELGMGLVGLNPTWAGTEPDQYIAVSYQVRDLLLSFGIQSSSISVVPAFIETAVGEIRTLRSQGRVLMQQAGVDATGHVIGALGSLWDYKGPDLFVEVARATLGRERPSSEHPSFVWVGGIEGHPRLEAFRRAASDRALRGRIHFVGPRLDPLPWLAALDVYALTSREDPFPLAMLEAAATARPIVAFATGGAAEFLNSGEVGALILPFDTQSMSERIDELLASRSDAARFGTGALRRVQTSHDVTASAQRIVSIIEAMLR